MTVFAKISPKPSITPFTNGKNMLMANEENNAQVRVRAGSSWSNMASVTDAAVAGRAEAAAVVVVVRGAGECGREGSGNDMEGKDDVGESMLSHGGESDGSPVLACGPAGAGHVGGAFELVDRGRFCYVGTGTNTKRARERKKKKRQEERKKERKAHNTSSARKERRGRIEIERTLPVWGDPPAANAKAHSHSHRHSRQGQCQCHG
jgi:hypothetical protein